MVPVLIDLSKLIDVAKNDVVKKNEYYKLVKKNNAIQTTDITSDFVKKTDHSKKINEIEKKITDHDHGKYITTQEFNKLTANNFAARLKQETFASKNDIGLFLKHYKF